MRIASFLLVMLFGLNAFSLDGLPLTYRNLVTQIKKMEQAQNYDDFQNQMQNFGLALKGLSEKNVCQFLNYLESKNIAMIEAQISESLSCWPKLSLRVEKYWSQQQRQFYIKRYGRFSSVEKLNFKFQTVEKAIDTRAVLKTFSGDLNDKEIAITFDDGPVAKRTPLMLNVLKEANVKATFFMLGQNVVQYSDIVKKVAAEGHTIGSHTYSHKKIPKIFWEADQDKEIRNGHLAIFKTLGWVDPFMRYPFGAYTKHSNDYLAQNSITSVLWNMDSEDWKTPDVGQLLNKALKMVDKFKKGVILFHDIKMQSVLVMPEFLKELYFRGYTPVVFVPQDEKLKIPTSMN